MPDLILHHYAVSPYAEKIRLALGRKGLSWHSVDTPMVMPKPDHLELTGGYRRVPVLQVGADLYCDTHRIAAELDRRHPEPPLSPPGMELIEHGLSRWAESTFMMVILAFFGLGDVFPQEFVDDRRKTMVPPDLDLEKAHLALPTKLAQIRANLDRLEGMLQDGRPFLLGGEPSLADLSAFHPLMAFGMHERTAALLAPLEKLPAWLDRVRAIGHGTPSPLSAVDAIVRAREAEPEAFAGEPFWPDGMKEGDPVVVVADEYGSGNVTGQLAPGGLHEIAVRRKSDRAGDLVVHFPREDYTVIGIG